MKFFIKDGGVWAHPSSKHTDETLYDMDAPEIQEIMNPTQTPEEIATNNRANAQVEREVENYISLRKAAYGTWEEQLEMQFDGVWDSHVLAVKRRYPKEEIK